jgi:hypothetical protein
MRRPRSRARARASSWPSSDTSSEIPWGPFSARVTSSRRQGRRSRS